MKFYWGRKLPFKFVSVVGSMLLGIVFTSASFAETKIEEVQPWPIDAPTQLIIWGTDFGDSPEFHFGTQEPPLVISGDQSLCPTPLGGEAPPLDSSTVDCVVVDLPAVTNGEPNVPAGDYLLAIWVPGPDQCASKPSSLTFEYTPSDCSGFNLQGASCSGDMTGSAGPANLIAQGHNNADWVVTSSPVANGGLVVFTGDGKWPNELTLNINDGVQNQDVQLHTSCSQPLAIGDVFGSMTLVAMEADLQSGMQHDLYDLTLGAVGPQGPQGKQGDIGPQGPQGKVGDTGAQGPQGKQGDTGAQGPQGKQGDEGAQGPQGKQGDEGAQGPQGKQGDQGEQGPQGKVGDTGAQGPQGKQGDTGAQGPQGKQGDTGAQGPQGKVGDTGAQGPQGKVGDTGAQGPQGKQGDTGAQGPQGKPGDTGATGPQGPQGKQGDTGAQGPQGKVGDTGAQGPQGKPGDTGAQGPQGKVGDTGAQGPQGKQGDTGAQGPQGKVGDTGAQGPQGKKGDKGDPGSDGIGSNLMCFSTDQTIGTSGKFMGLGQQAGEHDSVGVISPFAAGAEVITLVVKAAQGNQARSGSAQLFHDASGGGQGGEALGGLCTLPPTAVKSVCQVNIIGGVLTQFDSLSVFIEADSGSFEGGSACILIDPDGV